MTPKLPINTPQDRDIPNIIMKLDNACGVAATFRMFPFLDPFKLADMFVRLDGEKDGLNRYQIERIFKSFGVWKYLTLEWVCDVFTMGTLVKEYGGSSIVSIPQHFTMMKMGKVLDNSLISSRSPVSYRYHLIPKMADEYANRLIEYGDDDPHDPTTRTAMCEVYDRVEALRDRIDKCKNPRQLNTLRHNLIVEEKCLESLRRDMQAFRDAYQLS